MSVMKVIEIMGDSPKSFEDAVDQAVAAAAKSVNGIKSAWVKDQNVIVADGKVSSYRVALKITFEVKS